MAGCNEPTQVHWKPWDCVPGKAGNGRIKRMLQKQVRAIALKHDNDVIYIPAWWVRSLCIPSLDKENYYYPAFLTSSLFILLHSFHSYGTLGWVLWLELANPVPRATKFFFCSFFVCSQGFHGNLISSTLTALSSLMAGCFGSRSSPLDFPFLPSFFKRFFLNHHPFKKFSVTLQWHMEWQEGTNVWIGSTPLGSTALPDCRSLTVVTFCLNGADNKTEKWNCSSVFHR